MRRDGATPIAELRNLGPVSAEMLAALGITTRGDLERVGPVLAYRALKDAHPGVSRNLLYAMHGALTGERWNALSPATRARLRSEADDARQLPPTTL